MAQAVVSFVVERVGDLLIQQATSLFGVRRQVERARTELLFMQAFLKDADAKQQHDARVRLCVAQIRDAAYDLEDVIATYVVKVDSKRNGGMMNVLKRYGCIFKEGVHLHKIESEIGDITTTLSNLRSTLQTYNIREIGESGGATSSQSHERQYQLRRTYSHVIEHDVVGLEDHAKEVIMHLVNDQNCARVVSIWGMGGLGKTTLAKQVYHHKEVRHYFDCFAWVCISQQYQLRDVWKAILVKLISATNEQREEIAKLENDEIAKRIYQFQIERRCLVVLDDIWSIETWDILKAAFPDRETKSKILLTTRKEPVALHADQNGFHYQPPPLNEYEAWNLFEKIAILKNDAIDSEIYKKKKEMGKTMLRHCKGLPLAINVLAGLLARKNTISEWDIVHANVIVNIRRGTDQNQEYAGASWVLALSYDDLPYHLKPCFQYLGHYSEDSEIPVKRLTQLWIAEGLISSTQQRQGLGDTMEDIAYNCLSELVERCMIQVGERGSIRKIKTCRIHDLMRDLCLSKAQEENFLQIVNFSQGNEAMHPFSSSMVTEAAPMGKVRRLVVYLDESADKLVPSKYGKDGHLRSLLYFGRMPVESNKLIASHFRYFKFLRVLKLEDMFKIEVELPIEIGDMIHLRFLSLQGSKIKSFPSFLGNLICLQILDFRVPNWEMVIPNVIRKMKQLRHLYLPENYKTRGKLQLSTLHNLRTLSTFLIGYSDLNDVAKLTNLRKLDITLSSPLQNLEEILKAISSTLNRIRSLCVDNYVGMNSCGEVTQIVSSCPHIYKLRVYGPIVELPKEFQHYPNLNKLKLWGCRLKDYHMGILEKLPNLTTLSLVQETFEENTKILVFSKGGFRHLQFLDEIIEWRVEEGAIPNLCRLLIQSCRGLRTLPEGLRYVSTLRELTIKWMPRTFCSKLEEGGEDFYKIQHVPSLVIGEPVDE